MTLGEKLKQARLEKGLSQRELCGEEITRNMLSLIENGAARPSMDTLQYLAARLGKPVSWFLEENAVTSPNEQRMASARLAWQQGRAGAVKEILTGYESPDPVFDREQELLMILSRLALAETALEQGKAIYAAELLEQAEPSADCYCRELLERRRLLLLARARPDRKKQICEALPGLEEELILRAEAALEQENFKRAEVLLEAAEIRDEMWNLLRGQIYEAEKNYTQAAACYHKAEYRYPSETASRLEACYRELEDYKMAYFYACKQK